MYPVIHEVKLRDLPKTSTTLCDGLRSSPMLLLMAILRWVEVSIEDLSLRKSYYGKAKQLLLKLIGEACT